jgi:hypothetical protein
MPDHPIPQSPKGLWVGSVVVRADLHGASHGHDAPDQLLHGPAGGLGIRPPVAGLQRALALPLLGGVGAAPAKLRVVEAVDEVGLPDQEVQVEGPVVAGFERAEAIQHQGLAGRAPRPELFVDEQAVAAQALDLALDREGLDAELTGDLAEAGAAQDAPEERPQEIWTLEPVGE